MLAIAHKQGKRLTQDGPVHWWLFHRRVGAKNALESVRRIVAWRGVRGGQLRCRLRGRAILILHTGGQ